LFDGWQECKLRRIIGDPFDVDIKRLFVGTANGEKLVPVSLACHELVHDPLLLTPAVVKCLISDDQCDHTDQSDCLKDSTGDNNGDEHDGDADHVDESTFEPCTKLNVSTVDCSGLTTTIEPDCLKFIDILSTPEDSRAESKSLSVEQKQDDSLSHWWKMAEENKNGFFIHDDLLIRSERILGHKFKQLCVPQSRRNTMLDLAHNAVGAHMGIKRTRERILFSFTWPGLRADVCKYIQTCPTCQKHARITCRDRVPIKAIELDAKPFRVWFADILGPLFQDNTEFSDGLFDEEICFGDGQFCN